MPKRRSGSARAPRRSRKSAATSGRVLGLPSLVTAALSPFDDAATEYSAASDDAYPSYSKQDAWNLLFGAFFPLIGDEAETTARITISDEQYMPCPMAFLRRMALSEPWLTPGAYRTDVFDCDDYVQFLKVRVSLFAAARKFTKPAAVGFLLTGAHAFNFCIQEGGVIALLNTQSDARSVTDEPDLFGEFLGLVDQAGGPNGNRIASIYI